MSIEPKCELSNQELANKVITLTIEMAKTGGQSWILSVPVNFSKDPDILFIECADRLMAQEAELAAKDAEIERLKALCLQQFDDMMNDARKQGVSQRIIDERRPQYIKENNL